MAKNLSRAIAGFGWSFVDNLSGTGINFIVGLILARQLGPEIFGIVGIAMIFVSLSNVLTDGGFSNALIRGKDIQKTDYDTAFVINICSAAGIYLFFFATAPIIAVFFKEPQLTSVIRLITLCMVIGSWAIVPKSMLTRNLDFKRQAYASVLGSISGAAVGIFLVFNNFGIWSIVAQQIVRQTIYTAVLWLAITQRPSFRYTSATARHLFHYGSRILISGFIDSLYNNIYYFFIGKIFPRKQLGLYSRAEQFSSIVSVNFSIVLQRVSLPLLTQSHADQARFNKTYRTLFRVSMLCSALLFVSLSTIAAPLIYVLLGKHWEGSVSMLRILCWAAIFQPMIIINQNILQVYGEANRFLKIELTKKVIAVAIIAITIFWSINALLWGIVGIAFLSFLLNGYYAGLHFPQYSLRKQALELIFCLLLGCLIAFPVSLLCQNLPVSTLSVLIIQSSLLILICSLPLYFLWKKERQAAHGFTTST